MVIIEDGNEINVAESNIIDSLQDIIDGRLSDGYYPEQNLLSVVGRTDKQKLKYLLNRGEVTPNSPLYMTKDNRSITIYVN